MKINTTLNMHKDIRLMLDQAAEITHKSRSEIIRTLLRKVMTLDSRKIRVKETVRYQDCDKKELWHKFHIKFTKDEYEYFLDLRKLLKQSLSCLVAFAVKKYLEKMLNGEDIDNYAYKNYIISRKTVNGVICWKLFWGLPNKKEKSVQLT